MMAWHVYKTNSFVEFFGDIIVKGWGHCIEMRSVIIFRAMSHKVPSPKPLEINSYNLSHLEHGSCDLLLHMGPKSQI